MRTEANDDLIYSVALQVAAKSARQGQGKFAVELRERRPGRDQPQPIQYEERHYADQVATEQANLRPRQPALTS